MKTESKFGFMVLGGMIGIVGLFIGLCVTPLTAQRGDFDEIVCTSLRIVYPDGKTAIWLGQGKEYAQVTCYGTDGIAQASMQSDDSGGSLLLDVAGAGDSGLPFVSLLANKHGGSISLKSDSSYMSLGDGIVLSNEGGVIFLNVKKHKGAVFTLSQGVGTDNVEHAELQVTPYSLALLMNGEVKGFCPLEWLVRP